MKYNYDWDYIDTCDLEECEKIIRQAINDESLDDNDKREILYRYGRRREYLLYYPIDYTVELAQDTVHMNSHLTSKCMEAGRITTELIKIARHRQLEDEKLSIMVDVVVSAHQPWQATDIEDALVSPIMGHYLVCKSYYSNEDEKEYTDRNTILGLHDDDDNWNECLPEEWSKGMQLTMPYDRLRDGLPIGWKHLTEIRNYDLIIDETYDI